MGFGCCDCDCCTSQRRAYFCCSLRCHFIWWITFCLLTVVIQIFIGSFFLGMKKYLDELIQHIRNIAADDPQFQSLIDDMEAGIEKFWNAVWGMTTGRGILDAFSFLMGVLGSCKWPILLCLHFSITIFDFIADAILFVILTAFTHHFYIGKAFPVSYAVIFFTFGWQIVFGIYILILIRSYWAVLAVGGDGKAFKNAEDLREEKAAAAKAPEDEEAPRGLGSASREWTEGGGK